MFAIHSINSDLELGNTISPSTPHRTTTSGVQHLIYYPNFCISLHFLVFQCCAPNFHLFTPLTFLRSRCQLCHLVINISLFYKKEELLLPKISSAFHDARCYLGYPFSQHLRLRCSGFPRWHHRHILRWLQDHLRLQRQQQLSL